MSSLASQIASGSLSLPTLASFHASGLLICSNVRLHHRYATSAAVQKWLSSVCVRVTPSGSQSASSHRAVEGDLVLGLLYPPMPGAAATRIRDHTGALHYIEPRTSDPATHAPLRIVAVLGTRDSSTHVCGAVFDPAAAAAATSSSASALAFASMPVATGLKLAWLAEEGGLIGHLTSDAPRSVVLGARSESDQPESAAAHQGPFELLQQACAFEVIGPLVEPDGHKAINIRALCPVAPVTHSITPSAAHTAASPPLLASTGTTPRVILVGSTASTLGKTSLCCLIVQALHALAFSRSLEAPRIAFVKLTGSGGSRDMAQLMQLKNARGQRAVCAAFDHVDAGLATTYTPAAQAGPQALSAQQERFKHAIQDLIALASQPCAVPPVGGALPSRRSAHSPASSSSTAAGSSPAPSPAASASSKLLPPDFVVLELGSDLIFASNPVVLAASAHCIRDRLLGLMVLASDTLAILGALSWLHGNLRFPPELLHIVVDPRRNLGGMAKRISGSEIELHAMEPADIKALLQQIVPVPVPQAAEAASSDLNQQLPAPSLTAASFSAVASAVSSVLHTTALPSRGATGSPRTPSSTTAASNGSTSAASSATAPTPAWPSDVTSSSSSAASPVSSPRALLAADAEALAWFDRGFAPWVTNFPPLVAPSSDASLSPAVSLLCLSLVEWSSQCAPQLGALGGLQWQAAEVCLLLLRLSRSDRLARSLAYLASLRRRDKIRGRLAKEREAAARELMGASLGKLMDAKTGGGATAPAPAATPAAAAATLEASAAAAAHTSLLLSLPDLPHTPYAWLSPAVPPPSSAPAALLSLDGGLAVLRLSTVPARVSEQAFWDCYFGLMAEEMAAYLASKTAAGQKGGE